MNVDLYISPFNLSQGSISQLPGLLLPPSLPSSPSCQEPVCSVLVLSSTNKGLPGPIRWIDCHGFSVVLSRSILLHCDIFASKLGIWAVFWYWSSFIAMIFERLMGNFLWKSFVEIRSIRNRYSLAGPMKDPPPPASKGGPWWGTLARGFRPGLPVKFFTLTFLASKTEPRVLIFPFRL